MKLAVVEANPMSFAEFGRVVKYPSGTPTAQGPDFRFWSDLASYEIAGETEIGLCTVFRQSSPTIAGVERHLRTPEILIPVDAPFVLPLLKDGRPVADLKAFRVGIGEAVLIEAGVWHGPCLPVGKADSTYFVIFKRGTPQDDVERKTITEITLQL